MKSTCVSTSQRIVPATGSLLPTGLEPGVEKLDAALERGAISLPVEPPGATSANTMALSWS